MSDTGEKEGDIRQTEMKTKSLYYFPTKEQGFQE